MLASVIDDFGFDDPGFRNGGQIRTPTLDRYHQEGVTLEAYYVLPSCSPTRSTFMSGRMPLHTGINNWIPNLAYGLSTNETVLPTLLKPLGYRRHAVGKWCVRVMLAYIPPPRSALSDLCWCRHLGFFKTSYTPTFRDFESFYGYYEGSEE